jgi:hypothetical protein
LTYAGCDFGEVEKSMFHEVGWHYELIFCLPVRKKCDLGKVDKAELQGVDWPSQLIFAF